MSEITKTSKDFVGYEYMEVKVKHDMESLYTDSYPNFGWELDGGSRGFDGVSTVGLKFKRDRKLRNKAELTRLQRQFESGAKEIEKLEKSKTFYASIIAYIIGIIGTALMAGAVMAMTMANPSIIWLSVLLGVPAFAGWILPFFCYLKLKAKKTAKVNPLIDKQHDAIYEICEKANGLLAE